MLPYTVKHYLENNRVAYDVIEFDACANLPEAATLTGVMPAHIMQTVILQDTLGIVMAVIPITHEIDLEALSALLRRKLEPANEIQMSNVFRDCKPPFIPPLAEAYAVRALMDDKLITTSDIYFAAGTRTHLIKVSKRTFLGLQRNAWLGSGFARPNTTVLTPVGADENEIKRRIARIKDLPALPHLAAQIIELSGNPNATSDQLARIVELDPSLSAQVIRYANSPFYGYQGSVDSVRTAIARVLGYDMVMHLALGIAAARPFKIPQYGPLGLIPFWRHAVYSAALVQQLSRIMPERKRPRPGLAYLAGLLHNFGLLLLGHKFRHEFMALSDLVAQHPTRPITELEMETLGVTHCQIGAWLMEAWRMPPEIIAAVREHHTADYQGEHATYVQLCFIADCTLKGHDIGDAPSSTLPADILSQLQIDEVKVLMVMNRILQDCEGLNSMAHNLAT